VSLNDVHRLQNDDNHAQKDNENKRFIEKFSGTSVSSENDDKDFTLRTGVGWKFFRHLLEIPSGHFFLRLTLD
jgi:hypothetical protein